MMAGPSGGLGGGKGGMYNGFNGGKGGGKGGGPKPGKYAARGENDSVRLIKRLGELDAVPLRTEGAQSASTCSTKVDALVTYLRDAQPRKCLLFTRRRLTCRVLAKLLQTLAGGGEGCELDGWSVGWVMSIGGLGVARGRSGEKMSSDAQAATIAEFKASLRLLVATAIVT